MVMVMILVLGKGQLEELYCAQLLNTLFKDGV